MSRRIKITDDLRAKYESMEAARDDRRPHYFSPSDKLTARSEAALRKFRKEGVAKPAYKPTPYDIERSKR